MNNVLRLQAIAGSAADRDSAAAESETAASVFETEGVKIRDKIDKLTKQLEGLERDARLSSKRVSEQAEAVASLKTLCPEHIAAAARADVQRIENSLGKELRDGEIRLTELQCCLDPSRYQNEERYLESLQRSFPAAVHIGNVGQFIKRGLSPEWRQIRTDIENELHELQAKLIDLRSQYREAIEAAEAPLSFYS